MRVAEPYFIGSRGGSPQPTMHSYSGGRRLRWPAPGERAARAGVASGGGGPARPRPDPSASTAPRGSSSPAGAGPSFARAPGGDCNAQRGDGGSRAELELIQCHLRLCSACERFLLLPRSRCCPPARLSPIHPAGYEPAAQGVRLRAPASAERSAFRQSTPVRPSWVEPSARNCLGPKPRAAYAATSATLH